MSVSTTASNASPSGERRPWSIRSLRGDQEAERTGTGIRLTAEREWVLNADPSVIEAVGASLPDRAVRVSPGTILLRFVNQVGRVDLPYLGRVEVVSWKWGEDSYERMLADLVKVASNLPFSAGDQPALGLALAKTSSHRVQYQAFVYLRHVLSTHASREDRLLPSLEMVILDPHRRWSREVRHVPLEAMTRVDAESVAALATAPLVRLSAGEPRRGRALAGLAGKLKGHLPTAVLETRVRSDVDTPENRFVRRFLDECLMIAGAAERVGTERGGAFGERLASDARNCAGQLERVRRAQLWTSVGELTHLPLSSTVLRSRRGYREILAHWVRLHRTAGLPLDEAEAITLLESKDIALLYELWCYFQVVVVVQSLLGRPRRASGPTTTPTELAVEHEFTVEWDGLSVSYNGRFLRSALRGSRRAYSTPLRPDIVLEDHRNQQVHFMDAKFRVEPHGRGTDAGHLSFKAADLHKMHAYRDAVPAAVSAWVLYPGDDYRWYPAPPDAGPGGVGVIPVRPVEELQELRATVERILTQSL